MADRDVEKAGESPRAQASCAKSHSPMEPSSEPLTDLIHAQSHEPAAQAASEEPPVPSQPMSSSDAAMMTPESREDMTQRIHEAYSSSILYEERNHIVFNIATLQQMHLEFLRRNIGRRGFDIIVSSPDKTEEACRELAPVMNTYVNALRDFNYMVQSGLMSTVDDPFIITTEVTLQRKLLSELADQAKQGTSERSDSVRQLFDRLSDAAGSSDLKDKKSPNPKKKKSRKPKKKKSLNPKEIELPEPIDVEEIKMFGGKHAPTARKQAINAHFQRTIVALGASLLLLFPVLVMVYNPGLMKSLWVTSIFVSIFAGLAPRLLTTANEVISATAAYTAVLVVFLGAGGASTGG